MGPALAVDAAGRALLDAVVADGGGRVQAILDVGRRELLDVAGLYGVGRPDAGVAVGLQLEADGARRLALAVVADALVRADQMLDVVAVFVGDDVGLGERPAARAEA